VPQLCNESCTLRSAAYSLAFVLDANVYSAENGSNVCAFGRNKDYSNQVWRHVRGTLQTVVHGKPYCMTGVVTPPEATTAHLSAPPVRNMSVVMEPCRGPSTAGDTQRWALRPHSRDSFLAIVWGADPRLCVTLTADGSPDVPSGDAHDVRLAPCHNSSSGSGSGNGGSSSSGSSSGGSGGSSSSGSGSSSGGGGGGSSSNSSSTGRSGGGGSRSSSSNTSISSGGGGGGGGGESESALPAAGTSACADTAAGCAIYCQGIVCQDGGKNAWPAWSFLSIGEASLATIIMLVYPFHCNAIGLFVLAI
jgi:hypothetical protein